MKYVIAALTALTLGLGSLAAIAADTSAQPGATVHKAHKKAHHAAKKTHHRAHRHAAASKPL